MWWSFVLAGLLMASCAGDTDPAEPVRSEARQARDGSLRIPFLGGEFATWNSTFPPELEQAARGEKPDKPVIVWAGTEP